VIVTPAAIPCELVLRQSLTNWPALRGWFAASWLVRRHASCGDSNIGPRGDKPVT
jgi:hypothetical protein